MAIRELETVGSPIWRKRGHEIRTRVCEAGHGPAVDVREFITPEAHRAEDSRTVGAGKRAGSARSKSTYVGPTRSGLWLSPDQALEVAEAIAAAALRAKALEVDVAHEEALIENEVRGSWERYQDGKGEAA